MKNLDEAVDEIAREPRLGRAENYAEQIISHMSSGLMVVDTELNVRSMNHAMCDMFDIIDGEFKSGMPIAAIIPNAELPETLARMLAIGSCHHNLVLALPGKTAVRHVECNVSIALLEEKNVLLLMAQDITERMRSQEELQRFRMALDSSIDAVYLVDHASMRIIDANETASATLGYSQQELLALGPLDLKPDAGEQERIINRFDEVIQSHNKAGIIETVHQRKDGTRLPVEVYLRAVQSEGRQLLVAVVRDITSRLQAETELRESENGFVSHSIRIQSGCGGLGACRTRRTLADGKPEAV